MISIRIQNCAALRNVRPHERKSSHTSTPNVKLTPRSFSPQPSVSLSGSDHSRSHSRPWSGTSHGRMMRRICSIEVRSGLRPPWQQKIFSSTVYVELAFGWLFKTLFPMQSHGILTDSGDWQAIETIGERLPQFNGIATLALIVESAYV